MSQLFSKIRSDIESDLPRWANAALGSTALALLSNRIIKTGTAADGSKFSPYSTRPLIIRPESWSNKGNLSKAYKEATYFRKDDKTYAVLPGGYRRQRELDGNRQVAHKSFLYTGNMWQDVGVIGTVGDGNGKFTTTIAARGDKYDEILANHEKREGKMLLDISKKEEEELTEILDKYITNIVNRSLNG